MFFEKNPHSFKWEDYYIHNVHAQNVLILNIGSFIEKLANGMRWKIMFIRQESHK